jgi:hypothetical protein
MNPTECGTEGQEESDLEPLAVFHALERRMSGHVCRQEGRKTMFPLIDH